ncbi:hypothetical protein LC085_16880 [Bacillus tianshenii]|uniref:hypothetical protein n=1 Tax=Sutcliffiella tianshenii TaxID=1463404 RepID=UPI001CD2A7B2|nr:hypothetical protein [Bacillus tianshenii]MCA1321582.1 hypothetical protein [Bacillus tianshenii]
MSSIRVNPPVVKGEASGKLLASSAMVSKSMASVGAISAGIDREILNRRSIHHRLVGVTNSLHKLDKDLKQMHAFINHAMDQYISVEQKLVSRTLDLRMVDGKMVSSFVAFSAKERALERLLGLDGRDTGYMPMNSPMLDAQAAFSGIEKKTATADNVSRWKGDGYLEGQKTTIEEYGITSSGGLGYYEYDWAGLSGFQDGHGQIGGQGRFSGINGKIELDTSIIDMDTGVDMFAGEGAVIMGGKGFFPIAKVEGKVLGFEGKTEFDKNIPIIGDFGAGGKTDILKASAYAGIENNTAGFGMKASMAEAEGNLYIPLPFTDYEFKLIGGVSAGGAGGEVKVGAETSLDLRVLVGMKLGFGFEKDEE